MKGELQIEEASASALAKAQAGPLGGPRFRPLRFWREKLAKSDGVILGVDGEKIPVSLDKWADADPDDTMLAIYVRWVDPSLVGTRDPNPPGAISGP